MMTKMIENGFIVLYRQIASWGWYQDDNTKSVFIHLLLFANYEDHEFMGVTIHRGEIATSYENLANALKKSVQNVRTAIKNLKKTEELTITRHSKFLIITLKNYDKYQSFDNCLTINQQSSNNQLTINQQSINNNETNITNKQINNKERRRKKTGVAPLDEAHAEEKRPLERKDFKTDEAWMAWRYQ